MSRLDIASLATTLAEGSPGAKQELLSLWIQHMDDWDIFPLPVVLPGLHDADAQVRILTIKIMVRLEGLDKLPREGYLALWRMAADPDQEVRAAVVESLHPIRNPLYAEDLKELLPLLIHRNSGVRETAVQLFLIIPHYFNEEVCQEVVASAVRENLDIQATIAEFLIGLGQGHLLENGSSNDAGY